MTDAPIDTDTLYVHYVGPLDEVNNALVGTAPRGVPVACPDPEAYALLIAQDEWEPVTAPAPVAPEPIVEPPVALEQSSTNDSAATA